MSQTMRVSIDKHILEDSSLTTKHGKSKHYVPNDSNIKPGHPRTKSALRTNKSTFQLSDIEPLHKSSTSSSKLPSITELLNLKAKHVDPELHKVIIDLTKYAQNLEQMAHFRDKEIARLEYINKYLTLSQQNKEELLTKTIEENRRLKELTFALERKAAERKLLPQRASVINASLISPSGMKRIASRQLSVRNAGGFLDDTSKNASSISYVGRNSSPLLNRKTKHSLNRNKEENKNFSILKMNDEEVNYLYSENEGYTFLEEVLRNKDEFAQEIRDFDKENTSKFYDAICNLKEDHTMLKSLIFKLRRMLKATITMTSSLMIDQAIERIVDEACECLDCDRASIFLHDEKREELWTKGERSSDKPVRVPIDKGIIGFVFCNGETVNIHNAYGDERFNKEDDMRSGYKTNSILTVPLRDENNKIIGIIQAVNKRRDSTYFTNDDEILLGTIASLAATVLKHSMAYNEHLSFYNTLRSALNIGVSLSSIYDLNKLLPHAEEKLKDLIGVEKARIVLKNPTKNELFSIQSDGTRRSYLSSCGIVGQVITTGEYENITNGYGDPLFNSMVDIETSLPLLCVPIKHPSTNKTMGAIEVINTKGIQGLAAAQKASVNPVDLEALEFFSKQLAQAVMNCYQWEKGEGQQSYMGKQEGELVLKIENLKKIRVVAPKKLSLRKHAQHPSSQRGDINASEQEQSIYQEGEDGKVDQSSDSNVE